MNRWSLTGRASGWLGSVLFFQDSSAAAGLVWADWVTCSTRHTCSFLPPHRPVFSLLLVAGRCQLFGFLLWLSDPAFPACCCYSLPVFFCLFGVFWGGASPVWVTCNSAGFCYVDILASSSFFCWLGREYFSCFESSATVLSLSSFWN